MGEKVGAAGDQLETHNDVAVGAPPRSPWKTSTLPSTVIPAADSDSWPALSEAKQRPKHNGGFDSNSLNSIKKEANANGGGGGAPPLAVPTPPKSEQQKFNGRSNNRSARKPNNTHQPKSGPKHAANGGPAYPARLPYHPQPRPIAFHPMASGPIIPGPGYGYPFPPRPFPIGDNLLQSGSDVPSQAFTPIVNGGFQAPPRPGLGPHDPGSTGRMPNAREQGGQTNPSGNSQQPVIVENNFHMQQTMGPIFMRPVFFGPNGYDTQNFPGPHPGAIYYIPAAPPGSVRAPYPMPYPPSHGVPPMPLAPIIALRASIVKQFDYYFSDVNLRKDKYLISLMDEEGWVPISDIAVFKRVKSMSTDIPFILESLQASKTVEVMGEKIRRRDDWLVYIRDSAPDKPLSLQSSTLKNENVDVVANDSLAEVSSSNGSSVEPERLGKDSISEKNCSYTEQNTEGAADSVRIGNLEDCGEKGQVLSNQYGQNLDDSSNDLSSTFMLDEELEVQQKRENGNDLSIAERVDEEYEIMDDDHAVERLRIVTQKSRISNGPGEESETISNEIASAINDGLYFYEQELNANQSNGRPSKPLRGGKDDNVKFLNDDVAASDSKTDPSSGGSSCEESGSADSRMRHDRSSLCQHSVYKQRLFPKSFLAHRGGQNSLSESPPDDAVGFFFGSSPDSQGATHDHSSGSTRPVDSLPESFPTFQHPSHKHLVENGFKQQLYKKYHNRCLSEREKLGIGCSKEMNKLYKFWSYFLRNMFIRTIYNEFQKLALEDAAASSYYGIECLFRFYRYGLENEFREDLYDDFEKLTLNFYMDGNLYGLQKYWEFHHYQDGPHNAEPLKKHPELDRLLREEFCSMDDFNCARVKNPTAESSH